MIGRLLPLLLLAGIAFAADPLEQAQQLYERTEYEASLKVLHGVNDSSAPVLLLYGKDYYRLGDYKKATDYFLKVVALAPDNSEYVHWLGRSYGRRAETASPLFAAGNAVRARQCFERSVELDPTNKEALNDLFDFYLQAPGFLGGGSDRAAGLVQQIGSLDPAELHYAEAQIAQKKKEYDSAEAHLRRALALAPRQIGRFIDLARLLAKQGRYQESDATFHEAEKIAPNSPKLMFARANVLIEGNRNLPEAKALLEKYLQCTLGPEDPPREEALKLLKRISS